MKLVLLIFPEDEDSNTFLSLTDQPAGDIIAGMTAKDYLAHVGSLIVNRSQVYAVTDLVVRDIRGARDAYSSDDFR